MMMITVAITMVVMVVLSLIPFASLVHALQQL
jgi:hypothetical protein